MCRVVNLIDEYTNIINKYYDTPLPFITATGQWLISALYGRYFVCPALPENTKKPNLFFVLSSPPLFTRRTTVTSIAKRLFIKADSEITGLPPNQIKDKFIEEFTIEGIADHISATGFEDYIICSHEFGMVLTRGRRQYLEGMLSAMSKLYDGIGHKQYLSTRGGKPAGREIPDRLYVTMLAEMQKAEIYLNQLMLSQGFLRRVILIPQSHEDLDINRYKPFISLERKFCPFNLDKFSEKLIERGKIIKQFFEENGGEIIIELRPKVINVINKLDRTMFLSFKQTGDEKQIYFGSYPAFITKLAMIYAIADLDNEIKEGKGVREDRKIYYIFVYENHLAKAISFFRPIFTRVQEKLEKIITEREVQPLKTYETVYNKIERLCSGSGMTMGQLLNYLNTTKNQAREYLETMFEMEKLFIVWHKTSRKPRIVVFTDEEKAKQYYKKVENQGLKAILFDKSNYKQFLTRW